MVSVSRAVEACFTLQLLAPVSVPGCHSLHAEAYDAKLSRSWHKQLRLKHVDQCVLMPGCAPSEFYCACGGEAEAKLG